MKNCNNNYNRILGSQGFVKGDMFMIPGTFQPALSPRFSNVGYGANLLYKMPSNGHLGVPQNHPFIYGHPSFDKCNFKLRRDNRQI